MQIDIAVMSQQGGRDYNEDACGYWNDGRWCCCVVADGAGGHGGGDVASRIAVRTLLERFAVAPSLEPAGVGRLLEGANAAVVAGQSKSEAVADMRTTATLLVLDLQQEAAVWGNVGDTRLYGFRNGRVFAQSRDHSVVQSMVDAGLVAPEKLRYHPQRNVLLAALGSETEIEIATAPAILPLQDGDVFLICSDGVWEYVEESAMESRLARSGSPQEWLDGLQAEVLAHCKPTHDNYSAIAVWVGDPLETTRIIGG